jgi:hypothetical protein
MRYAKIVITINDYTNPKLFDVAGAMDSLPSLPLSSGPDTVPNYLSATGTYNSVAFQLSPTLVPTCDKTSTILSFVDKMAVERNTKNEHRENIKRAANTHK